MEINYTRSVSLNDKHCSCGEFTEFKHPCKHAACAIKSARLIFDDYVDDKYKLPNLIKTYENHIIPISTDGLIKQDLMPPTIVPRTGRPPLIRMRSRGKTVEEESPIHCSICLAPGHNMRTCERRKKQRVEQR